MSGFKKRALGTVALSWLLLAGCSTNSHIPEIRDAAFNRPSTPAPADPAYEVRLGDTLYSVAWRYNLDYHDLARWNGIQPPYAVRAGQKLRLSAPPAAVSNAQVKPLPNSDSMPVPANSEDDGWLVSTPVKAPIRVESQSPAPDSAKADTNGGVSTQVSTSTADHSSASVDGGGSVSTSTSSAPSMTKEPEHLSPVTPAVVPTKTPVTSADRSVTPATDEPKVTESKAQTAAGTWLWPTKGAVVGHFSDPSTITGGLDIAGQKGQPVVASRSGTVVYAGNSVRGYGNLVIIKHDDHFLSAYAHNDALKVKTNDTVKAGQMIATLGDSEADRPKLHFEIREDSQSKDPQQFLPRS